MAPSLQDERGHKAGSAWVLPSPPHPYWFSLETCPIASYIVSCHLLGMRNQFWECVFSFLVYYVSTSASVLSNEIILILPF